MAFSTDLTSARGLGIGQGGACNMAKECRGRSERKKMGPQSRTHARELQGRGIPPVTPNFGRYQRITVAMEWHT